MLRLAMAVLYTALALGANPGVADTAAADAARAGDMRKLVFHAEPRAVPEIAITDLDEAARSLSEWRGQWVVVNFWATWCAPCRKEMPSLDALAADYAVATVATGRNPPPAIQRFFDETGVTRLPTLRDPKSELARSMAVLGLPVTVILNPEGQEVARLVGDADWNSPDARAVMAILSGKTN